MALWIPCCLSHLTCETFKGQCFLAIGMFSTQLCFSVPLHLFIFPAKTVSSWSCLVQLGHQGVNSSASIDQFHCSSELLAVTLWGTIISTKASPHWEALVHWLIAELPFGWSCRWEQCPRAPVMFSSFPYRPGCGAGTTSTVCSLHWGAAGLCCHQLCCFPTVPLPTRIADSCENPSLIAQVLSTRKMFFSWKPHLCNPSIKG